MKTYLRIELNDLDYLSTNNLKVLNFSTEINTMYGEFRANITTDNPFGSVVHQTYDVSHGDKFYFLPGVTIPRVKLKDIANSHKIRTVRNVEEATHIFIGSDTVTKLSKVTWEYRVDVSAFKSFVEDAHKHGHMDEYYYQKITDALEFYNEKYIIADYRTIRYFTDPKIPYSKTMDDWESSSPFYNMGDHSELIKSIAGKDLYIEDALLEHVNGKDAVVIDETMFNTLSEMFESSDHDNWILAMEIMANCQYRESILYLGLLFYEYGNRIEQMSTKRHINFKSLVNYLGTDISGLSKDNVVDILIRKNCVTEEYMNILFKKFQDDVYNYGSSVYFKVKTITFSEEVDKLLNKEMTYQTKYDYKPVMIELAEAPIIETNGTTESEFNAFGF